MSKNKTYQAIPFLAFLLTGLIYQQALQAQKNVKPAPLYTGPAKKLAYTPDSLGNRIPDFSYCGYKAGEQPIPAVTILVTVPPVVGDATATIQSAIDYVSRQPIDKNGFKGTVLLGKGIYRIDGSLKIRSAGVVLRGSGMYEGGTVLLGAGKSRETLVSINGDNKRTELQSKLITNNYVPVNAQSFSVENNSGLAPGNSIIITRPSTKEWIEILGTDHFGGGITALGWKPGQRNLEWIRTITAVNGNNITLDAPITAAIDSKYGGGNIKVIDWPGRINNTGIENLQMISEYDSSNLKDEDHRWMAITIDNTKDAWVRRVQFKHFAGSAVAVYSNASRITIEDCVSLVPVSEIGGERRNSFFTEGQQVLFQRCYAEYGMHDFATGFCAAGPTAFVQCESNLPFGFSGGIDSWSAGVLFDIVNVTGHAISLLNRGQDGQGAGWNIANGVLWNCSAARIDCFQPPTAQNWAFGSWSQFSGNGYWAESNNSIEPRSLYYAQLKDRIGGAVSERKQVMDIPTDASSSPSIETAMALTKLSSRPALTLQEFIRENITLNPLPTDAPSIKTIQQIGLTAGKTMGKAPELSIKNGWLARGVSLLKGNIVNVPWWSGSARPYGTKNAGIAITRFVPGRTGKGLTDDLEALTDSMREKNTIAIEQNYGLWYDRRRDDHQRVKRMDGEVWAPFYELPFARTGQGTAWDGLSKYDLTKYNYWYWNRLKEFANLADSKGLVLIHQNYFQHNIIEAGAHYADFPWRTANNINNVGFPEPVPYAGDKRIFMAEQFYDTSHPLRRELHRRYIWNCLDNFKDNNGVIQLIGEEFTGPLHFVQFWLNAIREWEDRNGKHPLIGLSVTKDVQDKILADPSYLNIIDIINIKYWHYQADGQLYAPEGGQNLAPRQHARLLKPKSSSPQQVYHAVQEYKLKFPGKAVTYTADNWDKNGIAVLMAGGSLPNLRWKNEALLQMIVGLKTKSEKQSNGTWELSDEKDNYIFYSTNKEVQIDLGVNNGTFLVAWVNADNGEVQQTRQVITAGKVQSIQKPSTNMLLWLKRKK